MRPGAFTVFRVLAAEAFRDSMRRRIVPAVVFVSLLSLLAVDSCTSCAGSTDIVQNGEALALNEVAGWSGMVIYTLLSLWTMLLAGLLGSDHLAETISDGSANLVLARPVRRSEFALARLAGALGVSYAMGALVLTGTAYLLHLRHGVSLGAAAWAGVACAVGALVVAALAMSLSLLLPRLATVLTVMALVGAVVILNSLRLFGADLEGLGYVVQELAPPLCTSVVVALGAWIAPVELSEDPLQLGLKLAAWVIASVGVLLAVFRRRELGS
jgi:ABC-type transport system involved in multi-copper enzyme maturation permease subunit